jgi:ATP-dependent helicase Lhr and Lhr-like helicase
MGTINRKDKPSYMTDHELISIGENWFAARGWEVFTFQKKAWEKYLAGESGLVNAPTGSGKTFSLWIACLLEQIKYDRSNVSSTIGLKCIWITPLRALAKDIVLAMQESSLAMGVSWQVSLRTGDTTSAEKQKHRKKMPDCIVTTPESLHLFLSQKDSKNIFANLRCVIVDEWHELLGTKRGVQMELAIQRLNVLSEKSLKIWGVSATIANMDQALEVLLGDNSRPSSIIKSGIDKNIQIKSIIPKEIERFPWAGHLGTKLLPQILPVIEESHTTLLFTNTRSQTEMWYQAILEFAPHLAGVMAMHHGSIDPQIRTWVEENLSTGRLKLVVCTSSLDLGVDFRPVDVVIQIGGPKGVARFLQRAGRSGHSPGATSKIFFVPTHSLELLEGAALKQAEKAGIIEGRKPLKKSFDVLVQYLVTLAVGEGFYGKQVFEEVKKTFAYKDISIEEWEWLLVFITSGGESLSSYEEYSKVQREGDFFKVNDRKVSRRHRLSMGTIVSDPMLKVKFISGGYIGSVEESFISMIKEGQSFWFAGRNLEFVRVKDHTVYVKVSNKKKGIVPRWMGGRMPLSSQLSGLIREEIEKIKFGQTDSPELKSLVPLFKIQDQWSTIPAKNELLVEYFQSKEGYHLVFYPFEGRFVHEVLSALVAFRIGALTPISFSIAMNDYGFEMLSDIPIPIEEALASDIFSENNLIEDIMSGINSAEMAKRKFRDIAAISGLVFQGFPGKNISNKHLQSSSQTIFQVFSQYEPNNLLFKQAMDEVVSLQFDMQRLQDAVKAINQQKLVLKYCVKPTPFAFPIMVDRLRSKLSSEKLIDRVLRMQKQLEEYANQNNHGKDPKKRKTTTRKM